LHQSAQAVEPVADRIFVTAFTQVSVACRFAGTYRKKRATRRAAGNRPQPHARHLQNRFDQRTAPACCPGPVRFGRKGDFDGSSSATCSNDADARAAGRLLPFTRAAVSGTRPGLLHARGRAACACRPRPCGAATRSSHRAAARRRHYAAAAKLRSLIAVRPAKQGRSASGA
jgi:hypothetical protein